MLNMLLHYTTLRILAQHGYFTW